MLGMQVQEATLTVACGLLCMMSGACMQLHAPRKPSHRRIVKAVGWVGWAAHLACSAYLACRLHAPAEWAAPNKIGSVHVALVYNALLDQMSSLNDLPLWMNTALRLLHGLVVSAQFARYFEVFPGRGWWHLLWRHMLVWALPQVCLLVPYQLVKGKPSPQKSERRPVPYCAAPEGPTEKQQCKMDIAAVKSAAGTQGLTAQDSSMMLPDTSTVQDQTRGGKAAGCAMTTSCSPGFTASMAPAAAAGAGSVCHTALPSFSHCHTALPSFSHWSKDTSRSSRQLPPHLRKMDHVQGAVHALTDVPYKSRLGISHKACLKLRTDATCESLPPNLTQALSEALQNIQGPTLHITEVAVRPGCVLVTLDLLEVDALAGGAAGLTKDHQGLADKVAAALLPTTSRLMQQHMDQQHMVEEVGCETAEGAVESQHDIAHGRQGISLVEGALLQVDDQFFELHWCTDSSSWKLKPAAEHAPSATPAGLQAAVPWQTEPEHPAGSGSSTASSSRPAVDTAGSTSSSSAAGSLRDASAFSLTNTPSIQPWLGLSCVTAMQPHAAAATAATAGSSSVVNTLERADSSSSVDSTPDLWDVCMEVQVWQLPDKLTEVQGWVPTQHQQAFPQQQVTASGGGATGGGPLQVLVRSAASGGYVATEVVHMAHSTSKESDGPRFTTATVRALVPKQALFQHHPGSSPSSVLLCTAELWQEHVLLSSSPILAAAPPPATAAAGSAHGHAPVIQSQGQSQPNPNPNQTQTTHAADWWWGADHQAMTEAVAELTIRHQQLVKKDAAVLAKGVPAYNEFLRDLGLWLMIIRQESLSTGHCTSSCTSATASTSCGSGKHRKGALSVDQALVHVPAAVAVTSDLTSPKQVALEMGALQSFDGYTHHIHQAPSLPEHLQQRLADNLLAYTDATHMPGVHAMVSQQQRLLQKLSHTHGQHHKPDGNSSSNDSVSGLCRVLPAWLTVAQLREVMCGHTCDLCEMRYKQGLQKVVGNSRLMMSIAAAMLSTSAAMRAVAEQDWSFALCNVPWAAIHLSLTAVCFWVALRQPATTAAAGPTSGWGSVPMRGYLICVVLAWAYRVACTWSLALKGMLWQQPAVVGNFMFGNLAAWCFALTINGFSEQLQATALLPAKRVAQIVLGVDLPAALAWSGQELWGPAAAMVPARTWAVVAFVRFVVAPLLVLLPRLVTDASLRHHILHKTRPMIHSSRAAGSKAGLVPHAVGAISTKPGQLKSSLTSGGSDTAAGGAARVTVQEQADSSKASRAKQE